MSKHRAVTSVIADLEPLVVKDPPHRFVACHSSQLQEVAILPSLHAARGGGIAAVFRYHVSSAIAEGRLVELLGRFSSPEVPIQAVFPTSRLLSIKVRALLSILEAHRSRWNEQE